MENDKEVKITVENLQLSLSGIDYKALAKVEGDFRIVSTDDVSVVSASKEGFLLRYSREVHLNPNALFSLVVSFDVTGSFDQASKEAYKNDPDGFKRWTNKYQNNLIEDAGAPKMAAALIASITVFDGLDPIVLPPMLRLKKDEKTNVANKK